MVVGAPEPLGIHTLLHHGEIAVPRECAHEKGAHSSLKKTTTTAKVSKTSADTTHATAPFQPGPHGVSPQREVTRRRGCPAINEVVTGEHPPHVHKHGHNWPSGIAPHTQRDPEICHKRDGDASRFNKANRVRGIRIVPCRVLVQQSSRNLAEDADSPNKPAHWELEELQKSTLDTIFSNKVKSDNVPLSTMLPVENINFNQPYLYYQEKINKTNIKDKMASDTLPA
eukprot:bmy_21918T0